MRATTAQLIAAQPFLGPLAADPSLRGVASTLTTLAQGVSSGSAKLADVDGPVVALADAFDGVLAGRPTFFSWQALVAKGSGEREPRAGCPPRCGASCWSSRGWTTPRCSPVRRPPP